MKWFGKLLHLPTSDRQLLIEAAVLLGAIRVGLWLLPFPMLRRVLGGLMHVPPASRSGRGSPARIAWAVGAASRLVPKATCFSQALAAQVLIERQGLTTSLRIGVVPTAGGPLSAHAWLETGGTIVIGGGSEVDRFVPLPPFRLAEPPWQDLHPRLGHRRVNVDRDIGVGARLPSDRSSGPPP